MSIRKGGYSFNSCRCTILKQKHSAAGIQDTQLPITLFEMLCSFGSYTSLTIFDQALSPESNTSSHMRVRRGKKHSPISRKGKTKPVYTAWRGTKLTMHLPLTWSHSLTRTHTHAVILPNKEVVEKPLQANVKFFPFFTTRVRQM